MICFRCGFTIQPGEEKCGNCGADQRAKTPRTSPGLRDLFSSVREEPSIDRAPYLIGELVTERYELLDLLGSSTFSTVYRCLDKGLSFKISAGSVLTLSPPLTISREDLDRALTIVEEAIVSASDS